MEIGVGKLLEMFREFFGDRAAKILVAFIMAATVLVLSGLAWQFSLFPIFGWLFGEEVLNQKTLAAWVASISVTVISILVFYYITTRLAARGQRILDSARETLVESERYRDEALTLYEGLAKRLNDALSSSEIELRKSESQPEEDE